MKTMKTPLSSRSVTLIALTCLLVLVSNTGALACLGWGSALGVIQCDQ